jgi:hypothetical protein
MMSISRAAHEAELKYMLARKGVEAQIAKERMVYVLLIEKIEKGMPVDDDDRVLLRDLANYLVR